MPADTNWLVLGDFNYIRYPHNRNRGSGNFTSMMHFNEAISELGLVEIPLKGRNFTWSNLQDAPLLEKICWVFTSESWTNGYPNTLALPLSKPASDHTPCVILIGTCIPKSNIDFFWLDHSSFLDVVSSIWNQGVQEQDSAKIITAKFKRLRKGLNIWAKNLSNLAGIIRTANEVIFMWDMFEESRDLTKMEQNCREIIKEHLLKILSYQRIYWRQRATIRWVKFGDENSKIFQTKDTIKYSHNHISLIQDEFGTEHTDHHAKVALLWKAFKDRLGKSQVTSNLLHLHNTIHKLNNLDVLEAPFSKKEIDDVIKDLPADKAPGPDGFNGAFIKACWHIIAHYFYNLINDFYHGKVNLQSNASFITLIPKKETPLNANDFRPISLLNCSIKLITKLLANRLQKVIVKLVHHNQYGFIKNRTIQDCLAWEFEYLHQC